MNRNVDRGSESRWTIARAGGRVHEWFRCFGSGRAEREATLRIEERLGERARIARELHDTLLQRLQAASRLITAESERLPEDSACKPSLRRVLQILRELLNEGRDAVLGLRASVASSCSLEQALSGVAEEFMAAGDLDFQVVVTGQARPLKPEIQEEFYHIAREALLNALRHAQATRIEAEVEYSRRRVRVVVRDNGCGIDPAAVTSDQQLNLGLQGMRERAERIGAQLQVWSKLKCGTEVEVCARGAMLENPSL